MSLRSGEIHVMTDVPPDNVALLKKEIAIDVHVVAAPISILSYFNAKKAPFDNVKVRQALAHSMDRAGVNEVVYAGTAAIGQGPAGPAIEGHNPDAKIYGGSPDVDKAKALLAEAGAGAVEFTLMVSSSSKELTNAAQVLVEGWKQAGITCKLDIIDGGTWISRWMAGDYQMAMSSLLHRHQRRQDRVPAVQHVRLDERDELRLRQRRGRQAARPRPGRPARTRSAPRACSRPTPCSPPTPSRCRRSTRA